MNAATMFIKYMVNKKMNKSHTYREFIRPFSSWHTGQIDISIGQQIKEIGVIFQVTETNIDMFSGFSWFAFSHKLIHFLETSTITVKLLPVYTNSRSV